MSLKTLNYIRNKAQLQALFISQFTADYIRSEINEIIRETRKGITAGAKFFAKNISTEEAVIFIDRNGKPDGYILSDELKMMLEEYRERFAKKKAPKLVTEN
jgi:PHD/YefM family antitoxin component YafN of YafNO toxin-antitoxin module